MAEHGDPDGPRPVRRSDATLDLRSGTPVRHRQTRGVPREPDARLRAYRDRPARPTGHTPSPESPRHARPLPDPDPDPDVRLQPVVRLQPTPAPDPDADADLEVRPEPDLRHRPDALVNPDGADRRPVVPTETAAVDDQSNRAGSPGPELASDRLVVRRLRLRSVAKVALAFYLCIWAVAAVAGTILWNLANREGWVTGWTEFLIDLGFTDAAVDGPTLLRASSTAGAISVALATALTIAGASFYNQISGLIGGVEMTLRAPRRRRRPRPRSR